MVRYEWLMSLQSGLKKLIIKTVINRVVFYV